MSPAFKAITAINKQLERERKTALNKVYKMEKQYELDKKHLTNEINSISKRIKSLNQYYSKINVQIPHHHKRIISLKGSIAKKKSSERKVVEQIKKLEKLEGKYDKARKKLTNAKDRYERTVKKRNALKEDIRGIKLQNVLKLKNEGLL